MKRLILISLILLTALLLSSCSSASSAARGGTSWPGLAADAERAYLADGAYIYAVDLKTGKEAWRFPEKADSKILFFASPVLTADGQLLAGSEGSTHPLYSLDPATGKEKWAAPFTGAQDRWVASPLVYNEKIYAPNVDGSLYVLDMKGSLLGSAKVGGALWSQPVTDGKYIYLSSLDHNLHSVDINTLEVKQTIDLKGAIPSSPALDDAGVLYVGSFTSNLEAVANGKMQTLADAPDWIWGTPALDGKTLYYADLSANVYSFDLASGKQNWSWGMPDESIVASPLVLKDKVVVATGAGKVIALDFTGKQAWPNNYETGGKIYTNPIASGDMILVAPVGGNAYLVALDKDGKQAWTFTPEK